MLGLVVLPFSAMYEIFTIWIFGKVWCSIWLAVDVWMCTASILHLVIISLDRYIAVTHPITYPNLMTSKKAKLLILGAWIISFVVCFPPLVGWNDRSESPTMEILRNIWSGDFVNGTSGVYFVNKSLVALVNENSDLNQTILYDTIDGVQHTSIYSNIIFEFKTNTDLSTKSNLSTNSTHVEDDVKYSRNELVANDLQIILDRCQPKCMLTQDPGYVIYSSVGSFYAPMLIMMFLNWKIYRTASKTTKAIRQGWTKVKGVGGTGDINTIGMGIHRGGGGPTKNTGEIPVVKSDGCIIVNNKKLQNQKTCPSLTVNNLTLPKNSSNHLLGVNDSSMNDRRHSLNVPFQRTMPNSATSFSKKMDKNKHEMIVMNSKGSKHQIQGPLTLNNHNSVNESSREIKSNPIIHVANPPSFYCTKTDQKHIIVGRKNSTVLGYGGCEAKNFNSTLTNSVRYSRSTNFRENDPKVELNDTKSCLSSSKSHACIDSIFNNEKKKTKPLNPQYPPHKSSSNCINNHLDDYYKTHSLASIPTNEQSIAKVMNHTNNLANSTLKSQNNDKNNSNTLSNSNTIGIVAVEPLCTIINSKGRSETELLSSYSKGNISLRHAFTPLSDSNKKEDFSKNVWKLQCSSDVFLAKQHPPALETEKNGESNKTNMYAQTKTGEHHLGVIHVVPSEVLSGDVSSVSKPMNGVKNEILLSMDHGSVYKFRNGRNHQCRHSRRTFSEQATQTDPKSSPLIGKDELNIAKEKGETTTETKSSGPLCNDETAITCSVARFNSMRVKKLFSKKYSSNKSENNYKSKQKQNEARYSICASPNVGSRERKITDNICNVVNDEENERMIDNNSIDSKRPSAGNKSYLCFQCHPRRWTRRRGMFVQCCWNKTPHKKMMSFKHVNHSEGIAANIIPQNNTDANTVNPSTPNFHSSVEDDINIYPLTGVAAMINQVVNQTVNITAVATGPTAINDKANPRSGHFGKRNIKSQVRRFRMETKAAKTLGIIVGCFICCWFPFFTIYLIAAFCSDCIPEVVFDIFFWLGYCNSALNPFIYAMFSREFRGAFKRIVYNMFCMKYEETTKAHSVVSALVASQRNLDFNTASHLGSTTTANSDCSRIPSLLENKTKHKV